MANGPCRDRFADGLEPTPGCRLLHRGGPPTLALGVFQKLVDIPHQRDDLRLWKTDATYELPNRTAARQREAHARKKLTHLRFLLSSRD
jgi:hypothetical protein